MMAFGVKSALGRLRRKKEVVVQPIQVGDAMPAVDVEDVAASFAALPPPEALAEQTVAGDDGAVVTSEAPTPPPAVDAAVSTTELFGPGTGTTVLFGLPGAFTPTCSDVHVPGFVRLAGKFREAGVETIACTSTNDRFVLNAWNATLGTCMGVPNKAIRFLADGDGDLADKLGLKEDMGFGVGVRTQRFALVVDDGVVRHVAVDPGMDVCEATSAEAILAVIAPDLVPAPGDASGAAGLFVGLACAGAAAYYLATHPDLVQSLTAGGGLSF
mmetsp:Transcript_24724/g.98149  ORF Transcript_24724/g.98149 Transcript_24724/m.98149 type:complete len:271 (-) Transcript_24724:1298-2110(-)